MESKAYCEFPGIINLLCAFEAAVPDFYQEFKLETASQKC